MDLRAGQLRRLGAKVRLQEQPFRVLTALLESPGEVVTRDELRKRLWPADTFVDFDHRLASAISKLRDALKDSAENPRFVETVGRRGYRLMVPVEPVTPPADAHVPLAPEPLSVPRQRRFRVSRVRWASAVLRLLLALGFVVFHQQRQRSAVVSSIPRISSIAVLPLENLSNDPEQEYFAEGMTDEITTDLAKFPGVRVIYQRSSESVFF